MKVLSLFDGISCGLQALKELGLNPDAYYSSEIDEKAIKVSSNNHPEVIRLGDVRYIDPDLDVDLLLGGSPCQRLSFSGKRDGLITNSSTDVLTLKHYLELVGQGMEFKGESYLFWEYVRIREMVRPKWWLLENVMMAKKWKEVFDEALGVEGVLINSNSYGAQNRKRYYWTNIPMPKLLPMNGQIVKDILVQDHGEKYLDGDFYPVNHKQGSTGLKALGGLITTPNQTLWTKEPITFDQAKSISNFRQPNRVYSIDGKSTTLTTSNTSIYKTPDGYRRLGINELELLQGLPINYTQGVPINARIKGIGNGWHIPTIKAIFTKLSI